MKDNKLLAVIVIYNKKINESITCNNIIAIADLDVQILVVDNSDLDEKNEHFCKENKIDYISMKGNAGLSKAYNVAIRRNPNVDVIILFDDDTEVTKDYFVTLKKALEEYTKIDIFAPIIYGQDGVIYSPNMYNFLKCKYLEKATQEIPQDRFNGIASCLAIRRRVFDHYRFNEELFIDQVDQNFFWDQRKLGKKFMKLNVEIQQDFHQRGDELTPDAGWRRLRFRIIDIMKQARIIGGVKYRLLAYVKCCGLGVQIGRKCKSVRVILRAVALSMKLVLTGAIKIK